MSQIFTAITEKQHPELKKSQLKEALSKLVDLRLIVSKAKKYQSRDPRRRMVVRRDRGDASIDPETGQIKGGWNGWMVRDGRRGLVSVYEVTR